MNVILKIYILKNHRCDVKKKYIKKVNIQF